MKYRNRRATSALWPAIRIRGQDKNCRRPFFTGALFLIDGAIQKVFAGTFGNTIGEDLPAIKRRILCIHWVKLVR
jgi:hypothetical protein